MKDLKKLKNHKINRRFMGENVSESYGAMSFALESLGPALDLGLSAVKSLFCDAVKELKAMILRKPVYVNHVDIWFLRSMDPLSRDPLKLRQSSAKKNVSNHSFHFSCFCFESGPINNFELFSNKRTTKLL